MTVLWRASIKGGKSVEAAKAPGYEPSAKSEKNTHAAIRDVEPQCDVKLLAERDVYTIQLLSTAELALVSVTTPQQFFAPSEFDQFLLDFKNAQQTMSGLRAHTARSLILNLTAHSLLVTCPKPC